MTAGLSLMLGCYSDTAGEGLKRVTEEADGRWSVDERVRGTRNVSYAVWSSRHGKLYAVREEPEGAIDVLAPGDGWQLIVSAATQGSMPCHCTLDAAQEFLAVANYESGEVAVFQLDAQGLPRPGPWVHRGEGSGPDAERQEGPHAHWVGFSPDQGWLVQTDLGADVVRAFRFSPGRGIESGTVKTFHAPAGSGPRWIRFGVAGADALLVSELESTLSLYSWNDGEVYEWDRRSTRAPGAEGDNVAGHVAVGAPGNRIFVTNRGDDTVALFAIRDGHLDFVTCAASGGRSPRYLHLVEERNWLFVGHEEEGPVALFDVGGDALRRIGEIEVEKVAWIGRVPR